MAAAHTDLLSTTDAMVWAKEFVALVSAGTIDPRDIGLMLGWFANAIETGRNHHPAAVAESNAAVAAALGSDVACVGFQWLGQSWEHCERCDRPWHEHAGVERPAPGAGPFSGDVVVVPWAELGAARQPAD